MLWWRMPWLSPQITYKVDTLPGTFPAFVCLFCCHFCEPTFFFFLVQPLKDQELDELMYVLELRKRITISWLILLLAGTISTYVIVLRNILKFIKK